MFTRVKTVKQRPVMSIPAVNRKSVIIITFTCVKGCQLHITFLAGMLRLLLLNWLIQNSV